YQRNSCGYCHREDGTIAYYAHSPSMRGEEYEVLMNHGWRRLDPKEYVPRKDQKKALKRWNNFILGPEYKKKAARLAPKTKEQKRQRRGKFNLYDRIHESEYGNIPRPLDPSTKKYLEPAHKFEVNLESASFSLNKYKLFLRYQAAVHKEDESHWPQSSFKRFLCTGLRPFPMDNPFKKKTAEEVEREKRLKKLGSYHQCYRLDGELVAVAVLDLVPGGVSSVYLFYDPAYEAYEFGKLSAMREIAFTAEQNYGHYYMGFYIHSCVKMRYKADYRPQQILDPESYEWSYLDDELKRKLDAKRYVSRSREGKLAKGEVEAEECDKTDKERDLTRLGVEGEEERSLFEIGMPGVLTKEEVEKTVDLDQWQLMVPDQGTLVEMCDLVKWETSDIGNPQSVKGMVGELAAVLGREVVKKTVVNLF
ncbi:Arginyl-tRNA--protein transferase 1, partial [Ascosphaera atra]